MRYPKHLILDLQTPDNTNLSLHWKTNFLKVTSSSSVRTSPYFNSSTLAGPSVAQDNFTNPNTFFSSRTNNFDINFLRKEKLYTKLKYSRCPQYDIVSGGFAAILAGFIGFLISEKFGIELVDSGDFYIAFMYGVFGAFSLRPLVRIYSKDNVSYTPFSIKYLVLFMRDLVLLLLAELSYLCNYMRDILRL